MVCSVLGIFFSARSHEICNAHALITQSHFIVSKFTNCEDINVDVTSLRASFF
jgi:hypothetical protein